MTVVGEDVLERAVSALGDDLKKTAAQSFEGPDGKTYKRTDVGLGKEDLAGK